MRYHKLFQKMEELGIRPADLVAIRLVSISAMKRLMKDQPVSLYTLELISRYLEVPLEDLISADSD